MRIALVSYLNTTPFLMGLEKSFKPDEVTLMPMPPAACAAAMRTGEADDALLPIGALPEAGDVVLLEDHCIGANQRVDSVFLFSERPVNEVNQVVQDAHSRTSNALTAILFRHWWKRNVQMLPAASDPFASVGGTTAAVAIGDKAWARRDQFPHVIDLAGEWQAFTGLPMVFAVWAYREGSLTAEQIQRLDMALHEGRTMIREAATRYAERFGHTPESALHYLTHSIDFRFTAERHNTLDLFLGWLKTVDLPVG